MHPFKWVGRYGITILGIGLHASAAVAGTGACQMLSAEKFGEIMGYKARIDISTESTCTYKGSGSEGGMLLVIATKASPQTLAMAHRQGSIPQGDGGKLGATFSAGTVVFTVGITGTDPSKVVALAAEVKRGLK